MTSPVQTLFKAPRGIWLDYIDYAKQLFSSSNQNIFQNSALLISTYSQAQGLLKSDVIHLSVDQIYSAWIDTHPEDVKSWYGKRLTFALKKLLAMEEPRNILVDMINGLAQLNRDAKPFALNIGSPQYWLQKMSGIIRPNEEQVIGNEDIDSAAMYLSDFLRAFSTSGISAIVIQEVNDPSVGLQEALELYQPVLNLAKHYQWATGLSLPDASSRWEGYETQVDFTLFGGESISCLQSLQSKSTTIGGGLNEDFWNRKENLDKKSIPQGVLFGKIPQNANPETVLELLNQIRQLVR
ncbi:hypothetical protein [Alkalihalobacterium alkalinitrilicum]|uniref:hypothetical protein n=1 Tax=Alkalihalobacterium alkalinitrilicum TaxID=427920 RepID=UPI0009951359|nr:hypothetical protein [Alkalihalobacterium alkalinitrilicum]